MPQGDPVVLECGTQQLGGVCMIVVVAGAGHGAYAFLCAYGDEVLTAWRHSA